MRLRGLLIAAVALAVLGGLVYWSNKTKKDGDTKTGDEPPKLLTLNEAEMRKIELIRALGETTLLERSDSGDWRITSPQAFASDRDAVSTFVSSIASLSGDKLVDEKAADFGPYGLKEPRFVLKVTMKNGSSKTVLFGDDTPGSSGMYARLGGDARLFTVASYAKAGVDKTAADLRDKRLLTFDQEKLARLELTAKKTTTEFGKNARNEWQILKPSAMRADGWQVDELLRRLRDAKLDATVGEEGAKKNLSDFAAASPLATGRVTDASGTQSLEVRKTKDGRYLAKSSVVDGVHVLTSDTAQGLEKSTDDFRAKKLFDFGFNEPSRVEYQDAKRSRVFVKAGDRWLESNKALDNIGVQSLIDRLRDLTAAGFPSSGFTAPEIQLTVHSDNGKRAEKVLVSKAGEKYIARRDGEPSLYELTAPDIEELERAAQDVKEAQPPKPPEKKK